MEVPRENQLLHNIQLKIQNARDLYYRLILVVGPLGTGKTRILQKLAAETSAPIVNVNLG